MPDRIASGLNVHGRLRERGKAGGEGGRERVCVLLLSTVMPISASIEREVLCSFAIECVLLLENVSSY